MNARPPDAALCAAVQANCHIADARHATDLSLCTYLLQMREFYRWEQGLPFGATLERAAVGTWLAGREQLWAEVDGQEFAPLPGVEGDPLDSERIDAALAPLGLAYGAGMAARDRPAFFLAERLEARGPDAEGLELQVCGHEWARGLFAPVAMLAGSTIVVRRASLARWLWELFEAHQLRRADGAFAAVAAAFGLERDFAAALPRALDELTELLVLHERGEHRVGRQLGEQWAALRWAQGDRRSDLALRALRDLIVDLEHTLPELIGRDAQPALHFWFATFDGLRLQFCPRLLAAYRAWAAGDGPQALLDEAALGAARAGAVARRVLAEHGAGAPGGVARCLREAFG